MQELGRSLELIPAINARQAGCRADLMREGKPIAAVKVYQVTKKISYLRNVHEVVVFIVRAVTRPDFLSGFDISQGNIDKIRIFADLLDC